MPDRENVEEWARDFMAYVDELDIARDAYKGIMEYIEDALALLREQEPVQLIVRCKNCRHYNTACCVDGCGWCEHRNTGTNDEWYCADGEVGAY